MYCVLVILECTVFLSVLVSMLGLHMRRYLIRGVMVGVGLFQIYLRPAHYVDEVKVSGVPNGVQLNIRSRFNFYFESIVCVCVRACVRACVRVYFLHYIIV